MGTTTLVLGILGLAVPVLAPIAWILAARARKEVAREGDGVRVGGNLAAGYVLGIVGTCLWLGGLALFLMLAPVLSVAFPPAAASVDWIAIRFMSVLFALIMATGWAASSRV